jgi:hypothetical protein
MIATLIDFNQRLEKLISGVQSTRPSKKKFDNFYLEPCCIDITIIHSVTISTKDACWRKLQFLAFTCTYAAYT